MDKKNTKLIERECWVKYFEAKKKRTLWAVLRKKHIYLYHSKRKLDAEQVTSIKINEKTKVTKKEDEKSKTKTGNIEITSTSGTFFLQFKSLEDESSWLTALNRKIDDAKLKVNATPHSLSEKKGHTVNLDSRSWSIEKKLDYLRVNTIGRNVFIKTPDFWIGDPKNFTDVSKARRSLRTLVYEDFTASGRAIRFIDDYISEIMCLYANTHTEINATGSATSKCFEKAYEIILKHCHAPSDFFVIPVGAGVTGAIEKIQKILGIYVPPKLKKEVLKKEILPKIVAMVLPYEHHSNDISWTENTICDFVRIKCTSDFLVDTVDLEEKLKFYSENKYVIIASFSACSNVTGSKSDVKKLTSMVKRYKGIVMFDYAASGPYADINMERDGMDAIFLSPHKNLGGPGGCGILIGNPSIYDKECSPSFAGGGTVQFVTPWRLEFHEEISSRELAGTPPIKDVFQVALSLQLKDWLGVQVIEEIEAKYCKAFMDYFLKHPKIKILGNQDPEKRIPIISFLFQHNKKYLHQHFGCALLNDVFGIQSRSGCSCAGPWGHELLNIGQEKSGNFLEQIKNEFVSIKPGWVRLGLHYTMTSEEFEYTKFAINGIAWFGHLFLKDYYLDVHTGTWTHRSYLSEEVCSFGIDDAVQMNVLGSPIARSYIPIEPNTEAERNQQLNLQKDEFIRIISFKIMQLLIPAGSVDLYKEIVPHTRKFLESFSYDTQNFISGITSAIASIHTALNADEIAKILNEEAITGIQFSEEKVFKDDAVNEMSFFYCAPRNTACLCAKKGKDHHHTRSMRALSSFQGSKGTYF